jgi:hypothetical protein
MMSNSQSSGGLLSQRRAAEKDVQEVEKGAKENKSGDDLFTRTIMVAARKAYYGEQSEQVIQMIESGATPGAGVALATFTLLQMIGEYLNQEGKETPPDLLFNPAGPAHYIIEDLSELTAANYGMDEDDIEEEAEAAYLHNLTSGGPQQSSQQAGAPAPPQAPQQTPQAGAPAGAPAGGGLLSGGMG